MDTTGAPLLLSSVSSSEPSTSIVKKAAGWGTASLKEFPGRLLAVTMRHGLEAHSLQSSRAGAERGFMAIASAMCTDECCTHYAKPGREAGLILSLLYTTARIYPLLPLVVSTGGDAPCTAFVMACPCPERMRWWSALTRGLGDVWNVLSSIKTSKLLEAWGKSDFVDMKRDQFIKSHGGSILYLIAIGAIPGQQGRGLGSKIIVALCEVADLQQLPIYLEATTRRNAALYARHGFLEWCVEAACPGSPPMIFMWRPPSAKHQQPAAEQAAT